MIKGKIRREPRVNIADELVASVMEADKILRGEMAPSREHHFPSVPDVDVRAARERLGMTQADFARAFAVALPTLRKWEQGQRRPDGPARVLLRVIDREPDAVRRALDAI